MARARRPVGLLVLLDVLEVAIEVRNQHDEWCAVGMPCVLEARHRVRGVYPAEDDRDVRLTTRGGQLTLAGLSKQKLLMPAMLNLC